MNTLLILGTKEHMSPYQHLPHAMQDYYYESLSLYDDIMLSYKLCTK